MLCCFNKACIFICERLKLFLHVNLSIFAFIAYILSPDYKPGALIPVCCHKCEKNHINILINDKERHKDLTWFTSNGYVHRQRETFIDGGFTEICLQEEHIRLLSVSVAS